MKNSIIQKWILLILFLLSLIAKISAQSDAKIEFINATHDFDTIKQKSVAKYCFEFTNVGNSPLIITSVFSSCGCTVVSYPKEPIQPKKTDKIYVEYNTNKLGSFQKAVIVKSNSEGNEKHVLRIKGFVVEWFFLF